MQSPSSSPEPAKGLPPVAPPSGKFIAQLFLVPLAIVCVSVGIYYTLRGLTGGFGNPDPRGYLERLRDLNPDIRWRAADDLAQFLQKDLTREAHLASNPVFALDLVDLLDEAAKAHDPKEKAIRDAIARASGEDADKIRKEQLRKLEMERSYLEYLTASLGNVVVPVGVPVLSEIALTSTGVSEEVVFLKRRQAVWALANLGRNLDRFLTLSSTRQEEVLEQLEAEAGRLGRRAEGAKKAHELLTGRRDRKPLTRGLEATFAECAGAEDPELRKIVALALMFWEGDATENQIMELTLVKLAKDDGRGAKDGQSTRAREVRYQAAGALARRGSEKTPLPLLEEMLSESELEQHLRRVKEGREVPDLTAVQATLGNALKAVEELRTRRPERDLSPLVPSLEQLTQSKQTTLRMEAQRVLRLVKQ